MNKQELVSHYHAFCAAHGLRRRDVVVGAGGTCLLVGIRQSTADIDVTVPVPVMLRFIKAGASFHYFGETLVVEGDELVDLHAKTAEVEVVEIDGVWCESPRATLEFKRRLNRPKDQADIVGLQAYLTA